MRKHVVMMACMVMGASACYADEPAAVAPAAAESGFMALKSSDTKTMRGLHEAHFLPLGKGQASFHPLRRNDHRPNVVMPAMPSKSGASAAVPAAAVASAPKADMTQQEQAQQLLSIFNETR